MIFRKIKHRVNFCGHFESINEEKACRKLHVKVLPTSFSEIHTAHWPAVLGSTALVDYWKQKTPTDPWPTSHPRKELFVPNAQPTVIMPQPGLFE